MNIYALSCMYRNIVFGQFFKVGYFNIAYAIIVNCELLNGFTVNFFGLVHFNFYSLYQRKERFPSKYSISLA